MEKNNIEKLYRIAIYVTILLMFLSVCVLLVPSERRFKEKTFTTAYLSSDIAKNIDEINLTGAGLALKLKKVQDIKDKRKSWIAEFGESFSFPVDSTTMESFITTLTKVRVANEVSKKMESWDNLGVGENAFVVEIFSASTVPMRLYFGKTGMGSSRISFRSEKSVSTYQAENDIDTFLQTDPSFWADPYLIAGNERNKEDLQFVMFEKAYSGRELANIAENLISLRRGLLCEEKEEKDEADSVLEVHFLSGNVIKLSFYNADTLYFVKSELKDEKISYWFEISAWTYQKLQEIFTKTDDSSTASRL